MNNRLSPFYKNLALWLVISLMMILLFNLFSSPPPAKEIPYSEMKEKIRAKLLTVPPPLKIGLITKHRLNSQYQKVQDGGWTLVRHRVGNAAPEPFDDLDALLKQLIADS